jgi:hypothetical protein
MKIIVGLVMCCSLDATTPSSWRQISGDHVVVDASDPSGILSQCISISLPSNITNNASFHNRLAASKTNTMGSVVLPHLVTGWHVDQAIMSEDERLVIIRFGRDWDPDCMRQDEVLYRQDSSPQICCSC